MATAGVCSIGRTRGPPTLKGMDSRLRTTLCLVPAIFAGAIAYIATNDVTWAVALFITPTLLLVGGMVAHSLYAKNPPVE